MATGVIKEIDSATDIHRLKISNENSVSESQWQNKSFCFIMWRV